MKIFFKRTIWNPIRYRHSKEITKEVIFLNRWRYCAGDRDLRILNFHKMCTVKWKKKRKQGGDKAGTEQMPLSFSLKPHIKKAKPKKRHIFTSHCSLPFSILILQNSQKAILISLSIEVIRWFCALDIRIWVINNSWVRIPS